MRNVDFSYERESLFPGCDGVLCKVNPKMAVDGKGVAFLHYSMLKISGCDVFKENYIAKSIDGGKTFAEPIKLSEIERMVDGVKEIFFVSTILYNKDYDKWIAIGALMYYENEIDHVRHKGVGISKPVTVLFDPEKQVWCSEPEPIELPFECISALPHSQPIEYENNQYHLGYYANTEEKLFCSALTAIYEFDGKRFILLKSGQLLEGLNSRGFMEPSLAKLNDKYYITLRTDEDAMLATSDDGLVFNKPKLWTWDDGSLIGSQNTMQRWIRYKDALYLAYTRKTPHNNHIFRNRAPMFMARFDEEKECLIRDSEVIIVPEMGARLGNFNVTDVSENEFWLVTAEWMQTVPPNNYNWKNCVKYGADNRIWRAKIKF